MALAVQEDNKYIDIPYEKRLERMQKALHIFRIPLKEVRIEAGVSSSAVDCAINGRTFSSTHTFELIDDTIEQLVRDRIAMIPEILSMYEV